jgi:hypothetical protein
MALTPCRECGKHVSHEAQSCPHCGAPFPWKKEWNGWGREWKSKATLFDIPLVHVAYGRDKQGKLRVAKGIIAIGQFAVGAITIAQFGVGLLFGFGQFMLGLTAIAQFAVSALLGVGQFATGWVAMGQFVLAYYGLAQMGFAVYLCSVGWKNITAAEFFQHLLQQVKTLAICGAIALVLFFPKLKAGLSQSQDDIQK